ncbi:hypothetical protein ACO0LF_28780 [Undibacterium sp. Di27W]
MPFTPFHFGCGALAKTVAPKEFSFVAFAIAQIAMAIEPGIRQYATLTFRANNLAHKMAQIHLRATLFGAIMA